MHSKIIINIIFITGLLLFAASENYSQETDYLAELEYEIEYEIELPKLKVKGFFVNNTTETFEAEYLLKVQKSSGSGNADSDQKGTFTSAPMERIFLSESIMNISEDAEYNISLEIKSDKKIIAEKIISIKGQEF